MEVLKDENVTSVDNMNGSIRRNNYHMKVLF